MSVQHEASIMAAQTAIVLSVTIGMILFFKCCCCCCCCKKKSSSDGKIKVTRYEKINLTTMSSLMPYLKEEEEAPVQTCLQWRRPIFPPVVVLPVRKCVYYKFNTLTEGKVESSKFLGLNSSECDEFSCFEIFLQSLSFVDVDLTVILHISSPGGQAYKFEKLHDIVASLKIKPNIRLVAFIDDICASGGYMVACACHEIVCTKTSLIGSIGVYCSALNASKFADKVGFDELVFKTTAVKGGISTFGKYTDEDYSAVKANVEYTFSHFKKLILQNRPLVNIEQVATAETWYGTDALALQLVDRNASYYEFMKSFETEVYICSFKSLEKKESLLSQVFASHIIGPIVEHIIRPIIEPLMNRIVQRRQPECLLV